MGLTFFPINEKAADVALMFELSLSLKFFWMLLRDINVYFLASSIGFTGLPSPMNLCTSEPDRGFSPFLG